jgi:hypothetical protein
VAVVATLSKGYDLDYIWKQVDRGRAGTAETRGDGPHIPGAGTRLFPKPPGREVTRTLFPGRVVRLTAEAA